MAVGLVIDLKTPQKVGSLTLITSTPGMTVQVYGANGQHAAHLDHRSGLDPAEPVAGREEAQDPPQAARRRQSVPLRHAVDQRRAGLRGRDAPDSPPGHVSVNELELFPAK